MALRTFLISATLLSLTACASAPATVTPSAPPPPVARGMVSAADPRAAEAGAQMLRQGGSATDAAIATMLALTVVEPQSSGIGGGGFYVRASGDDGSIETLDGRETAPAAAGPDWFLRPDGTPRDYRETVITGLSVGVPGNMALAAEAHARHGKLPWSALFQPAIALARDGWELTDRFHMFLTRMGARASHDPSAKALYFDEQGQPRAPGTTLRNPALADLFTHLAEQDRSAFYTGEIATGIALKVALKTPREPAMSVEDVRTYQAVRRDPVCGTYRTYRICGMAPPSSGATTVLAILGQLERFDISQLRADSPAFWHLFAESQRLAYADRERFLADPGYVTVPVAGLIERSYLARRGALIRADSTMPGAEPGLALPPPDGDEPPEHGTSHFVVVDGAGNAVSYTSTIEGPFGSGLMIGGFFLNNELTDFSFSPQEDGVPVANRVQGGKRPRSSMAPTLVYDPDGKVVLAIGAAGGGTIPVQVARALIGFIDWKLPIGEALALPMLYSPGDTVVVEKGSALEAMIPALEALGHKKVVASQLPVKTNAIAVLPGSLDGAADPRSEGAAISQ